uniref:Uncharacterized protein n=1 Tax=Monopterus albus TaxID=43700 RepID=A0A3Q3JDF5_MONAL
SSNVYIGGLKFLSPTFLACWCVFVWWLLILLFAAQITSVDCHSRFYLLLGQLHALIKYLEEFLRLVVPR